MAKFKFRLATLLRLREADRDERRTEMAQAYRADEIIERQQEALEKALTDSTAKCRDATRPGQIDIDHLLETQRFEVLLRAQREQLRKQRGVVAAEIERRRGKLVHANREVRVLEKLREKQTRRHRDEENRREIKRLDEAAMHRAGREEVR